MVAELGGAEREASEGGRGGHVGVRRRRRQVGEVRLELVMGVGVRVAGPVMRVHGRRGEEPVRVSRANAQGDLVNNGASLGMRDTVPRLEERRRVRGEHGVVMVVGVVRGGEGAGRRVGEQGVRGQTLGVCVRGGGSVRGAAMRQVCESVRVNGRGDVGVRPQRAIVAVPLLAAVAGTIGGCLGGTEGTVDVDFLVVTVGMGTGQY